MPFDRESLNNLPLDPVLKFDFKLVITMSSAAAVDCESPGVCGPLPKTLTLFMTKICDFPYPIYDLTKNLIPNL